MPNPRRRVPCVVHCVSRPVIVSGFVRIEAERPIVPIDNDIAEQQDRIRGVLTRQYSYPSCSWVMPFDAAGTSSEKVSIGFTEEMALAAQALSATVGDDPEAGKVFGIAVADAVPAAAIPITGAATARADALARRANRFITLARL